MKLARGFVATWGVLLGWALEGAVTYYRNHHKGPHA